MIIKNCEDPRCGKEFEAKSKGTHFCPECQNRRRLEAVRRCYERNGDKYKARQRQRNRGSKSRDDIEIINKRIEKVKKAHAALNELEKKADKAGLTYGQYVLRTEIFGHVYAD